MTSASRRSLSALQRSRLRAHRLDPSQPVRSARAAAAFIRERGIVMSTGRSALPVLAEAVAGRPIRGSWMADDHVHAIYRVLGELRRHGVLFAPLILGKETLFTPELGPAVQRLAADPQRRVRARRALSPAARRLLETVEAKGSLRMDTLSMPAARSRPLRVQLERELLVVSRDVHTQDGYHTSIVQPWNTGKIAARFGRAARRLTFAVAVETLLLVAMRSAVVAPEAEVRRWFVFGGEAADLLMQRGALLRLSQGRRTWLTLSRTADLTRRAWPAPIAYGTTASR